MATSIIKNITDGMVFVGSEVVNCSTSGYVASGSSGTASGTFTMLGTTTDYSHIPIPLNATYSYFSSAPQITSANGGTVSVNLTNNSGASHTLSCNIRILKFERIRK